MLSNSVCFSQSNSEPSIKGKLHIDSRWKPVVYLSYIPTFKDMSKMSSQMIIAEAKVDSLGYFSFPVNQLPKSDRLYRIHISKKKAPPASLIIGGEEENHIFFIANPNVNIYISNTDSLGIFNKHKIQGYLPNNDLSSINKIIENRKTESSTDSRIKREFLEKNINSKLRRIADTSSHPIVSLYALNQSNFESTFLENQKFYKNYLKKWKNEDSLYFTEFRTKLPTEENTYIYKFLLIALGFFSLGFIINYLIVPRKKHKQNRILTSLSIQERKIFALLQDGKSNKEISEELNIGISTVKSHISSIYNKLNVKSRKDILNLHL